MATALERNFNKHQYFQRLQSKRRLAKTHCCGGGGGERWGGLLLWGGGDCCFATFYLLTFVKFLHLFIWCSIKVVQHCGYDSKACAPIKHNIEGEYEGKYF